MAQLAGNRPHEMDYDDVLVGMGIHGIDAVTKDGDPTDGFCYEEPEDEIL
jgi:hypothetical protein